jgi:TPR repeat protein
MHAEVRAPIIPSKRHIANRRHSFRAEQNSLNTEPIILMWQTGTSAASWELRSQGRYEEAWQLVKQGCDRNDAEALMEMPLCYPDVQTLEERNNGVKLSAAQGHPVAMAMASPEPNIATVLQVMKENMPAHAAYWAGKELNQISLEMLFAANKWHHPLAAAFLADRVPAFLDDGKDNRKERVHYLRIAAYQNCAAAIVDLAHYYFHGYGTAVHQAMYQGARLLSYFSPARQCKYAADLYSCLRARIIAKHELSDDRIRELYVYGKAHTPTIIAAAFLADHSPRHVYLSVQTSCRSAVLYVIWSFRREFRWPRDLCKMLAQMVWNNRENDAALWYYII